MDDLNLPFHYYRVHASIVYKNPQRDAIGFPDNAPIHNPDPDITIHNEELEELVCTVKAETEAMILIKFGKLLTYHHNQHIDEIVIHDVVEL